MCVCVYVVFWVFFFIHDTLESLLAFLSFFFLYTYLPSFTLNINNKKYLKNYTPVVDFHDKAFSLSFTIEWARQTKINKNNYNEMKEIQHIIPQFGTVKYQ